MSDNLKGFKLQRSAKQTEVYPFLYYSKLYENTQLFSVG